MLRMIQGLEKIFFEEKKYKMISIVKTQFVQVSRWRETALDALIWTGFASALSRRKVYSSRKTPMKLMITTILINMEKAFEERYISMSSTYSEESKIVKILLIVG